MREALGRCGSLRSVELVDIVIQLRALRELA
jgi:hypothetical protein